MMFGIGNKITLGIRTAFCSIFSIINTYTALLIIILPTLGIKLQVTGKTY